MLARHVLLLVAIVFACDSTVTDAPPAAPQAEPLVCGLHHAQITAAMTTLSTCTGRATAAVAAKTEPTSCAAERAVVTATTEDFLECIDKQNAGGGMDGAVAKMGEFADRICACPDQPCADKVTVELTKWGEAMQVEQGKDPKLTPQQQAAIEKAATRLAECMTKTMSK
jgi:hypothetical protein